MRVIDYEGRVFRSVSNSGGGDVGDETTFEYHQRGELVWGTYSGGSVQFGTLMARADTDGNLEMTYQHLSVGGDFKSGRCRSRVEQLLDGRLRLHEEWEWTGGAEGRGLSIVEEAVRSDVNL